MMKKPNPWPGRIESPAPATSRGTVLSPWFWVMLAAPVMVRCFSRGVSYWPVLDDNNMYGMFSQLGVAEVWRAYPDFFMTRPAAVAFDVLFISRLWAAPWLVAAVMASLSVLFLRLVHHTLESLGIPVGAFALVCLALDPFNLEAVYWLAASSRILMGCLGAFASLALVLPLLGRDGVKPRHPVMRGVAFWAVNLVSFGFYEQTLVLSLFLCGTAILFFSHGAKRRLWLLVPLCNLLLIGGYYLANAGRGNMAQRGALVRDGIRQHLSQVAKNAYRKLFPQHALFVRDTSQAGLHLATGEQAWLLLALFVLLAAGLALLARSRRPSGAYRSVRPLLLKLLAGLSLLVVPLAPFFLLADGYMAIRNFFPSMIGLALLLDLVADVLASAKGWRIAAQILVGFAAALCLLGSLSEIRDYQAVSRKDGEIVAAWSRAVVEAESEAGRVDRVVLLNVRERYPALVAPHFSNCTAADWTLMGAVGARAGRNMSRSASVVKHGGIMPQTEVDDKALLLGIDEAGGGIVRLRVGKPGPDGTTPLTDRQGKLFGSLRSTDEGTVFARAGED